MDDLDQRVLAIQKLQMVRQFAAQDKEPCEVLPGLFIGRLLRHSSKLQCILVKPYVLQPFTPSS